MSYTENYKGFTIHEKIVKVVDNNFNYIYDDSHKKCFVVDILPISKILPTFRIAMERDIEEAKLKVEAYLKEPWEPIVFYVP